MPAEASRQRLRYVAVDHGLSLVHRVRSGWPAGTDAATVAALLRREIISVLARLDVGFICDSPTSRAPDVLGSVDPARLVLGLADVTPESAKLVRAGMYESLRQVATRGLGGIKVCLVIESAADLREVEPVVGPLIAAAHEESMMILAEAVPKPRSAQTLDVAEAARIMSDWGPSALKLPFPRVTADNPSEECRRVTAAAGSVPWALLSAGVSFDIFERQLRDAVLGGGAGFVAGAAVWQEGVQLADGNERSHFFHEVAFRRVERLLGDC